MRGVEIYIVWPAMDLRTAANLSWFEVVDFCDIGFNSLFEKLFIG